MQTCSVLGHTVDGEDIGNEDPRAAAAASNCTVVSELSTSMKTVCDCTACSSAGAAFTRRARMRRRLAQGQSFEADYLPGQRRVLSSEEGMEGINLVGTAEFVGAQYATIMSSASSYNSKEAILGTLMLLVTFASCGWACHYSLISCTINGKEASLRYPSSLK